MNQFHSEINVKFNDFLDQVKVMERKFNERIDALKTSELDMKTQADKYKSMQVTLDLQIEKCQKESEQNKNLRCELDNQIKDLQAKSKQFTESENNLNTRQAAILAEYETLNKQKIDLEKKEKWLDMDERRLILFDKQLKMLASDKEIAKKLKELT